jgi:hypothetical protein
MNQYSAISPGLCAVVGRKQHLAPRLLALSLLPSLLGCAAGMPDFGPSPASTAAVAAAPRMTIPQVTAGSGPFTVLSRRIDAAVPGRQNWEISVAVTGRGESAEGDRLALLWMTGEPSSTPFLTTSGLAAASSTNGGRDYLTVPAPLPPGSQVPFDPMLAADRNSGRVFRGAMSTLTGARHVWVEASAPGGGAFSAPLVTFSGQVDKGLLAAGPRRNGAAGGALYLAHSRGVQRSLDGGASFSAPQPIAANVSLPMPLVSADGTLRVIFYDTAAHVLRYTTSIDEGLSFGAPVTVHAFAGSSFVHLFDAIPGSFRLPPTTMLAQDPIDGRLYAVIADQTATAGSERDVDLLLYHSDDGGAHWTGPRPLAIGAPAQTDQFMPALAVDATGRLHLAFYDSRRTGAADASANARVDAWYARSDDRGLSWSSQRLNDQPIESERSFWSPLAPSPTGAQFIGDYLGIDVSAHAAYASYTTQIDGELALMASRIDFAATKTIVDPRGLTGLWYDPLTDGQGFDLQWIQGDLLTVVFYGHRDSGANLFLTGVRAGVPSYGENLEIDLTATEGGRFNGLDPAAVHRDPWGRVTLRFNSCSSATATLDGRDGQQTLALVRLTLPAGLSCGP